MWVRVPSFALKIMKIIVTTPKTEKEFYKTRPELLLAKIGEIHPDVKIGMISENRDGLPKVYNRILDTTESGIVVFMHDDVEIHDLTFVEKLRTAHTYFDIVGVAGATRQEYSMDRPCLWHMNCRNFRYGPEGGDGRGFIQHPIQENSLVEATSFFGPTPARVAFIDGCFMSFDAERVRKTGFRFDENFKFHHYDLSACKIAERLGLTIGVWPIHLLHQSPGLRDINDPIFQASDRKFKELYVQ